MRVGVLFRWWKWRVPYVCKQTKYAKNFNPERPGYQIGFGPWVFFLNR